MRRPSRLRHQHGGSPVPRCSSEAQSSAALSIRDILCVTVPAAAPLLTSPQGRVSARRAEPPGGKGAPSKATGTSSGRAEPNSASPPFPPQDSGDLFLGGDGALNKIQAIFWGFFPHNIWMAIAFGLSFPTLLSGGVPCCLDPFIMCLIPPWKRN